MKIVYIADCSPAPKRSKRDDLKQAATLLASQLRGTGRRKAQRILEIELNEKTTN